MHGTAFIPSISLLPTYGRRVIATTSPKPLHPTFKAQLETLTTPARIIATVGAIAALTVATTTIVPKPIEAVSGGGKDFASQNHDNETFHGDYAEMDFSGGLFRACDFIGANLTSARLFKAELREANLSNANLSYATIEAAILRETKLDNAVLIGAYISDSILDAASIRAADFSDALITPASVVGKLCAREDAVGINSVTGVPTRESLMCPD